VSNYFSFYTENPEIANTLKTGFDTWFYSETTDFSYICEYFYADIELEDDVERRDTILKWLQEAYRIGYEDGGYLKDTPSKEQVDAWALAADPQKPLLMQIAAKSAEWGACNS
jgi:hypothetical protein